MQKFVLYVNGSLKINMLKIKNIVKLEISCHYAREYRGTLHMLLKCSASKNIYYTYTIHRKILKSHTKNNT